MTAQAERTGTAATGATTALVRAELLKLTSVRTPRWVLLAQVALLALAASGAVVSGALTAQDLARPDGLRRLLEHGGVVGILSLAVGITLSAGEFRHGTAVDTFLTEPRRVRATVSKLLAGLVAGLVAGVVVATATLAIGAFWCRERGVTMDWSVAWRSGAGVLGWQALYTVIGVALGAVVRAQATAVVAAVVWLFVAETAIAQLADPVGRWLPATAAAALGNAPDGGLLPQAGGGLVLLAWTLAAGVTAAVVTARRDLT